MNSNGNSKDVAALAGGSVCGNSASERNAHNQRVANDIRRYAISEQLPFHLVPASLFPNDESSPKVCDPEKSREIPEHRTGMATSEATAGGGSSGFLHDSSSGNRLAPPSQIIGACNPTQTNTIPLESFFVDQDDQDFVRTGDKQVCFLAASDEPFSSHSVPSTTSTMLSASRSSSSRINVNRELAASGVDIHNIHSIKHIISTWPDRVHTWLHMNMKQREKQRDEFREGVKCPAPVEAEMELMHDHSIVSEHCNDDLAFVDVPSFDAEEAALNELHGFFAESMDSP